MKAAIVWIIAVTLALSGYSDAAHACHFKAANAIVCTSGTAAVVAQSHYGENIALTNQSYSSEILRNMGCGRPYGKAIASEKIQLISHGRVATGNGWTGISTISVNGKDIWYVADAYLDGVCEKYTPR